MPLTWSDICKVFFAIFLPPLGVLLERGFGADFCINILLTILGYIPDIIKLAKDTQIQVKNALNSLNTSQGMKEMVNVLDDVSDKLCIVTDSSECIRRLHPDMKWRRSADQAFNITCNLMNELNSNQELIDKFIKAEKCHVKGKNIELDAVVQQFKRDFELFYGLADTERTELSKLQRSVEDSALEFEKRQSIDSLEKMIKLRFELSRALGFKNPSEMSLRDKQIKSTEDVMRFLDSRWKELQTIELNDVNRLKFTNIESIIKSLKRLSRDLFNVRFEVNRSKDFAGNPSYSFNVYDKCEYVGEIIFDLSVRRFKDTHPTHYTIQCRTLDKPARIVISMSIEDLNIITWNQSQSLFHEFGHALHSALSETKYQMLSGTRGPVDLAEIPSTLFELIHDNIQETLKTDNTNLLSVPGERILKEETFQLQISAMDQLLHSTDPGNPNWTRDLAHKIENDFKNKLEANWHFNVQHFASYGGGYFAYSFSKSVAERIWKTFPESSDTFKKEFLAKGGTATIDFIK